MILVHTSLWLQRGEETVVSAVSSHTISVDITWSNVRFEHKLVFFKPSHNMQAQSIWAWIKWVSTFPSTFFTPKIGCRLGHFWTTPSTYRRQKTFLKCSPEEYSLYAIQIYCYLSSEFYWLQKKFSFPSYFQIMLPSRWRISVITRLFILRTTVLNFCIAFSAIFFERTGPNCSVGSLYLEWMSTIKMNFDNTVFFCKHFFTVFTGKELKTLMAGKQDNINFNQSACWYWTCHSNNLYGLGCKWRLSQVHQKKQF